MDSLKAGLLNELLLLSYRKKTLLFLIFSALLPIILVLSLHSLKPAIGLVVISQSFPIQMLSLYTLFIIPLFIFLTSADLFPNERAARTLKLTLLRPTTRFQAFTAKILALGTVIAVMFLVLAIVTLSCFLLAGNTAAAAEWIGNGKAYIAGYISMMALAVLFVFVAQFFHSAAGYLVFSVLFYAAAKLAPFFISSFSAFSLTAYTDWYMLWLSHTVSAGQLLTSSLFILSGLVLFFSLGYFMFERREA